MGADFIELRGIEIRSVRREGLVRKGGLEPSERSNLRHSQAFCLEEIDEIDHLARWFVQFRTRFGHLCPLPPIFK